MYLRMPLPWADIFFPFFKIYTCIFSGGMLLYLPWLTSVGNSTTYSKEVQRMAKCQFCDKGVTFGIQVSHSHRRSNRTWKPNVKRVKAIIDGTPRHVYVCTRCLRSGKVTRAV